MEHQSSGFQVNLYYRGEQRLLTILLKSSFIALGCFAAAQAFSSGEPHSRFLQVFSVLFIAGGFYYLFRELHYPGILRLSGSTLELKGLFGRWTVQLEEIVEVNASYGEILHDCSGGVQLVFSHFPDFPVLLERLKSARPGLICRIGEEEQQEPA